MSTAETFERIKALVHQVLPDAEVILFGSRANKSAHDESDWDVLVLTNNEVTKELDRRVFNALYPLSIEVGFIHPIVVNKKEWRTHPRYYTLQLSIDQNPVLT